MDEETLREQENILDSSIFFLLIVIASILLSFAATLRQRRAVCLLLAGQTQAAQAVGDVDALRCRASALLLGALGFFLALAVYLLRRSAPGADRASAQTNLWASALVLAAAILRWRDLQATRSSAAALPGETGPLADTLLEP